MHPFEAAVANVRELRLRPICDRVAALRMHHAPAQRTEVKLDDAAQFPVTLNIPVILGSVRRDRIGLRVALYAAGALRERAHEVTLIDPVEHPLPLLDRMYKEYTRGQAPAVLEGLAGIVRQADAYVIVSAEYNHSVPPALSNLLDHFLEEYFFKPSAIVCYSAGSFGGVRAAMQLRAMLAEMGMSSIPSILPFPKAHELLDQEGRPTGDRPGKAGDRFFDELEWYARALRTARSLGTPY